MTDAPVTRDSAPSAIHHDELRSLPGSSFALCNLLETDAHEGPVYVAAEHALYFTTTPDPATRCNAIMRLRLSGRDYPFAVQALETVRRPANMANGMCLDRDNCLVICEQGTSEHPARIARMQLKTGRVETLVDQWKGEPFNSPNDVVVKSDGTIWFTDPNYGELQGFKSKARLGANVYRFDPATAEASAVAEDLDEPNGLAFSPDERLLYVTDSGAIQAPGSYCPDRPHHVRAFEVVDGGHLRNARVFAVVTPGIPDGIKVDEEGRVYASSASGVQVFSPDGDRLGEIAAPGATNFVFGGPARDVLFILRDTAVLQAALQARGLWQSG
jgi:gluconolactonase